MQFIEYSSESENQSGCMSPERLWMYGLFTLVIAWLTRGTWLVTTAHQERVSYCISLAWEKIKIQSSMYGFYRMCIAFAPL